MDSRAFDSSNGTFGAARVNGTLRTVPNHGRRLIDWLREDLGLTGTKYGCGAAHCGACTVLVDGKARYSCITLAATLRGAEITTIEGLVESGDPLPSYFHRRGALQCGFCTPGMIVTARAYLADSKDRIDEAGTRRALAGNICRCTGYTAIVAAVADAADAEGVR